MTVLKTTNVQYNKVAGGQTNSFSYNFSDTTPERVSVNLPVNKVDAESKEVCNGNLSLGVNMANRLAAKEAVLEAINAAFDEIENILVNYQNPEVQA